MPCLYHLWSNFECYKCAHIQDAHGRPLAIQCCRCCWQRSSFFLLPVCISFPGYQEYLLVLWVSCKILFENGHSANKTTYYKQTNISPHLSLHAESSSQTTFTYFRCWSLCLCLFQTHTLTHVCIHVHCSLKKLNELHEK